MNELYFSRLSQQPLICDEKKYLISFAKGEHGTRRDKTEAILHPAPLVICEMGSRHALRFSYWIPPSLVPRETRLGRAMSLQKLQLKIVKVINNKKKNYVLAHIEVLLKEIFQAALLNINILLQQLRTRLHFF